MFAPASKFVNMHDELRNKHKFGVLIFILFVYSALCILSVYQLSLQGSHHLLHTASASEIWSSKNEKDIEAVSWEALPSIPMVSQEAKQPAQLVWIGLQ